MLEMSLTVLEALRILYERRQLHQESHGFDSPSETAWLDPKQPLTREEIEQVAEAVYALMQQELRTARERQRGF
jgi:hypothetical protein